MYAQLYNPNSKIIIRTTVSTHTIRRALNKRANQLAQTQDRMLKSAEYFAAGFFGLQWTRNATIEVIIEENRFNNSLAGYLNCPNSNKVNAGTGAASIWINNYLQNGSSLSVQAHNSRAHLIVCSNCPSGQVDGRFRLDYRR
jgi:hypothetical protein